MEICQVCGAYLVWVNDPWMYGMGYWECSYWNIDMRHQQQQQTVFQCW
jgi:hypothetical protein